MKEIEQKDIEKEVPYVGVKHVELDCEKLVKIINGLIGELKRLEDSIDSVRRFGRNG